MGAAFYIVLDNDNPGFDDFVNGKFLAHDTDSLEIICKKLNLPTLFDYADMSEDDIFDLADEEPDISDIEPESWFPAEEGIRFVISLMEYIRVNPGELNNAEGVLEDLEECRIVLEKAAKINAKWHFGFDF